MPLICKFIFFHDRKRCKASLAVEIKYVMSAEEQDSNLSAFPFAV